MVALLMGMAVAAMYMSAALPAWRQQAQREKEEELIFRGRAVRARDHAVSGQEPHANPPDIDILVSQHFLRKKWKDPVTGEDFVPLGIGVATPGSGSQPRYERWPEPGPVAAGGQPLTNQNPGVSGVRSKSTATSIKIYEQQQQHSLWPFDAATRSQRSGRQVPQQPGQPAGRPGRRTRWRSRAAPPVLAVSRRGRRPGRSGRRGQDRARPPPAAPPPRSAGSGELTAPSS